MVPRNKKVVGFSEFVELNERRKPKGNKESRVSPEDQFKNEHCSIDGAVVGIAHSSDMGNVIDQATFDAKEKISATGYTGATAIVKEKITQSQDGTYKCMVCLKKANLKND